jgi:hypothetical protein
MPNAHHLHIAVVAEGPTRVLRITDSRLLSDGSEPIAVQPIAQSSIVTDQQQQQQQAASAIAITASVSLAGIGMSIIDKRPRELVYMLAGPISVDYSNTGKPIVMHHMDRSMLYTCITTECFSNAVLCNDSNALSGDIMCMHICESVLAVHTNTYVFAVLYYTDCSFLEYR